MIGQLISWSLRNRVLVLITAALIAIWGAYATTQTSLDALPDLSDAQVIIKTTLPGQAPQVVEEQVTFPLTTAMLSVPGAVTVRGYSFFGDSYVYVIFEDGTDLYWARSRVLEYLSQVTSQLPAAARPTLGPDATGVGWIYEYALVDRSGNHDLAQLRSLQDWFLKYELQSVAGVAEVATVGGMVRQYQVVIDPDKMRAFGLSIGSIADAIRSGNQESGGSVIEMGEAEYMVRATGYIKTLEDLESIVLGVSNKGLPTLLSDVALVRFGPQMRRGVAELNGEGEVVGGIVVMRWGENALATIARVKARLQELRSSLPEGVELIPTYDRSQLIHRAVGTLKDTLFKELAVVALVCAAFLLHLRSAAVVIVTLPLGILAAFIVMHLQGITANIMSLGGIAIAVGVMVDAAMVLIENVHKHLEARSKPNSDHWDIIERAAVEVGPPIFFSLLIVTLSFLPIFALEAQEGRLFAPLAYTKTYAMAAAAAFAVTLVPVLVGYFVRGPIRSEQQNPLSRLLITLYRPAIQTVVRFPGTTVTVALLAVLVGLWPASRLGSEFMPPLDEGDLMYMPTTFPGVSIDKAREILQQTNRMIRTVPEVSRVFGKVGRAETATDPAPLTMIETLIQLKPRSEWRTGLSARDLRRELDQAVQYPGISNVWVMPIKTRIDMLATGIKTPLGVKISGPSLSVIETLGETIASALQDLPGTVSAYSERVTGGRYVVIDIDRSRASRYGMNIDNLHEVVGTAIGGSNVSQAVLGLERYPINVRYPQRWRDSVQQLRLLPMVTPSGAHIALADVADIRVEDGPPVIKSENARPTGWVLVDFDGPDLGTYVARAREAVNTLVDLPAGYSLSWSGQYEFLTRAKDRLLILVPVTLGIIVLLLYLSFRRFAEVGIVLGTLPLAAVGGVWLLHLLDYEFSVAVGVGFIALAGVAVEIGVVMLVYLNQALHRRLTLAAQDQRPATQLDVANAVMDGAVLRLRPVAMTVTATFAGLLPIMLSTGTGSEVMRRIAAPMVGGLFSATILTLLVVPALFLLWHRRQLSR